MAKAIWNDKVIAESNDTVVVEGNHYFPRDPAKAEYLRPSSTHTTCPWKGKASYNTLEVDGQQNPDAAWFYPEPKSAAQEIKDHFAFWKGVRVENYTHPDLISFFVFCFSKTALGDLARVERPRSLCYILQTHDQIEKENAEEASENRR